MKKFIKKLFCSHDEISTNSILEEKSKNYFSIVTTSVCERCGKSIPLCEKIFNLIKMSRASSSIG